MATSTQVTHKASTSTKQKFKKIQSSSTPQVTSNSLVKTMNHTSSTPQLRSSTRDELISKIAYRMAEQRGFTPGHELDDWLAAEFEVNQSLMGNGFM